MRKLLIWFLIIGSFIFIAGCRFINPQIATGSLVQTSTCNCTENANNVSCFGLMNCTYVFSEKDIYFINTHFISNGSDDSKFEANSTKGNLYFESAQIEAQGVSVDTSNYGNGSFYLKSKELISFKNTLINASGDGASGGFLPGDGNCNFVGMSFYAENLTLKCNGGDSAGTTAEGGWGTLHMQITDSITIKNSTIDWHGGKGTLNVNRPKSGFSSGFFDGSLNTTRIYIYNSILNGTDGGMTAPNTQGRNNSFFMRANKLYLYNGSRIYLNGGAPTGTGKLGYSNSTFELYDGMFCYNETLIETGRGTIETSPWTIINFTSGMNDWFNRPKLVLNNKAVFRQNIKVYSSGNVSVVNLSQYYPHNLTINGAYANVSEGNLYYIWPANIQIDVLNDGTIDYSIIGEWNGSVILYFNSSMINSWLNSCNVTLSGNCTLPIKLRSSSTARINITNLSMRYPYPGLGINNTLLTGLTNGSRNIFVFVNYSNASSGFSPGWNFTLEAE